MKMVHAKSAATTMTGRDAPESAAASGWRSHRGQVLVIFSGIFVVLLLMSALVIDLAWLWNNSLRIQRTADAAALAGVVYLPNDVPNAVTYARREAKRNGYDYLATGVTVSPTQDGSNTRRLNVKVTAPVQTFFLGLIGMNQVIISRTAHAEYVLPVPMGSPENYYGVFGNVRNATFTIPASSTGPTTSAVQNTGTGASAHLPTTVPSTVWTATTGTILTAIATDDTAYAGSTSNASAQRWGTFGLTAALPTPGVTVVGNTTTTRTVAITGLQLQLIDAHISAACASSNIKVELTWNAGTNWTPITIATGTPTTNQGTTTQSLTTTTTTDYTMGNTNNTTPWGAHPWVLNTTTNDFSDAMFQVRTTVTKSGAPCLAATRINLDRLEVGVYYTVTTSTSTTSSMTTSTYPLYGPGGSCVNAAAGCYVGTLAGGGQALNPRGFWGTMNTEGAENANGDAFQPYYDTATSTAAIACPVSAKACYGPTDYYNYAIDMAPGTSGGYVYIFDPVFCETAVGSGTGDRHFGGSAAVSTFYELYSDPNNTPYILSDDTLVVGSGNKFTGMAYYDSTMGGSNGSDCKQTSSSYGDARDYHNAWYLLNPSNPLTGGVNGTTYRVHTTGTDPNNVAQQRNTNGEQSFAIYATDAQAPATYPKVYGLGAMQAFTPLSAAGSSTQSEFYLAQIDPIHNGKTLEIRLWDPGDTSPLTASLQILIPNAGTYQVASVTYSGAVGTTNGNANSACNSNSRSTASNAAIQTSTGASLGLFNGCWLTIDTVIPSWYTGDQQGWWKIRYTMNGNGTSNDVTTWMADIRGNPVHLVEP